MSNFPALEVVIGLSFVYFVLSLICSAVAESISSIRDKRARMLKEGIENLLSGGPTVTPEGIELAGKVYAHPLIQGLIRAKKSKNEEPRPSYIPSRTFVSALLDLGARNAVAGSAAADVAVVNVDLLKAINGIGDAKIRQALLALYRDADGQLEGFRRGAEQWFDDSMARVSGWYRRHVQLMLWLTAAVVAVTLNVDTLQVANTLWKDPATRAAVVARAETVAQQGNRTVDVAKTAGSLELPLGWKLHFGNGPQNIPNDPLAWIAKLVGLLLTAAALSLGAPFWFDLLSKFVRVRGTGPPPPSAKPS